MFSCQAPCKAWALTPRPQVYYQVSDSDTKVILFQSMKRWPERLGVGLRNGGLDFAMESNKGSIPISNPGVIPQTDTGTMAHEVHPIWVSQVGREPSRSFYPRWRMKRLSWRPTLVACCDVAKLLPSLSMSPGADNCGPTASAGGAAETMVL